MAQSGMRVTLSAAMRARDVSRPHVAHITAALRRAAAPDPPASRSTKKRTRPARRD